MFAELRALLVPLLTYTGTIAISLALFGSVVVMWKGLGAEDVWILGSLVAATVFGVGFGQLCALTRIRTWIVVTAGALVQGALFVAIAVSTQTGIEAIALPLALIFLFFPFFSVAGLLSLRTSTLQVFALFAPMVFVTGAILIVAQDVTGSASRWFAGQKWAVWDVFTAPILLVGVALSVGYLVSRERYRLYRWATADAAPQGATVRRIRGSVVGATASGCGSLLAMSLLVVVLTVGTGLLSPYLWRTGPGDGDGEHEVPPRPTDSDTDGDGVDDEQERRDGTDAENPDTDGDGALDGQEKRQKSDPNRPDTDGDGVIDGDEPANGTSPTNPDTDGDGTGDSDDPNGPKSPTPNDTMQETMKNAGLSLFFLVLMVLLSLLGLLVFGPPFRRSLVLGYLRSPPLPTPPSDRVANAWRLCEIALGDLGVERFPGDTASALALRAGPKLPPGLNLEPLLETADIADRVRYGLGLDPQDEMRARRNAEMAYQGIWEALSEWDKIRAVYRNF